MNFPNYPKPGSTGSGQFFVDQTPKFDNQIRKGKRKKKKKEHERK